jgi:hypothetical protein
MRRFCAGPFKPLTTSPSLTTFTSHRHVSSTPPVFLSLSLLPLPSYISLPHTYPSILPSDPPFVSPVPQVSHLGWRHRPSRLVHDLHLASKEEGRSYLGASLSSYWWVGGHRFHHKWKAKKGQAVGKYCQSSLTKITSDIRLHGQSDKSKGLT